MKTRTDRILMVLTVLFVGALALVAGAISFSHMRELALEHDQLGWKSLAFPISVDGLEIVASLYLVSQRRAGRPTGWIPWLTLFVGTGASLAANIAVGGADPIGKALAGWPALSMLVSVKLLFSMFDHVPVDQSATVRDDQRTSPPVPDVPEIVQQAGRESPAPSGTVPDERTDLPEPSATGPADANPTRASTPAEAGPARTGDAAERTASIDIRPVVHLMPAARAARAALAGEARSLSRDNLAKAMRDEGCGVSNQSASLLLRILKAEQDVTAVGALPLTVGPASDIEGAE